MNNATATNASKIVTQYADGITCEEMTCAIVAMRVEFAAAIAR